MLAIVASWAAGEFFLRRFDRGFIEAFVSLGLFLDRNGRRLRHRQRRDLGRRQGARPLQPEGRRHQRVVLSTMTWKP